MKRFHFSIFLLAGVFMVGCQDQLAILEPVLPEGLGTKGEEITVQTNERYVFPAEKDFKAWVDIVTLEDRLAACEVPENVLHSMTTDALVRTVLNYPLFFIYSAYDNPLDAVDIIVKSSRLHRELFTRSDAAEVLLRHFDETYMDTSGRKSMFNLGDTCLTPSYEMYFEYLLSYYHNKGLFKKEDKKALQKIAQRKLTGRESDPDFNNELFTAPLQMMAGGDSAEDAPVGTRSTWTWHTPFGKSITVNQRDEMSDAARDQLTYEYMMAYPNATVHGMASNRYNGHGYAWIIRDPTVSINDLPALYYISWVNNNQVTSFTTDYLYDLATASDAERIVYVDINNDSVHSAVPYPNSSTMYQSKWGDGPLMEHAPAYCPYPSTILRYYKIRTEPYDVYQINGYNVISLNTNATYTWQATSFYRLSLSSSAENISPAGAPPVMVFVSDYTRTIKCTEAGVYRVQFEACFGSSVLARSVKDIAAY